MAVTNNTNDKKNNYKKIIKDITPKVCSVLAALFLWFYVNDIQNVVTEKTLYGVPVVVENEESLDSLAITSGKDYTVDITVSGLKEKVRNLTNEDFVAYIDVRGIDEIGSHERSVNVDCPDGVSLVSKSVSKVMISIDEPISVEFDVLFEPGKFEIDTSVYEMLDPVFDNQTVRVSGPKSIVENIAYAKATYDLGTVNSTTGKTEYRPSVSIYNSENEEIKSKSLSISPSYVTVRVPVNKTATVPIKPAFSDEPNEYFNFDWTLEYSSVVISGDASLVDDISFVSTETIQSNKEAYGIPVVLKLPEGITAKNPDGTSLEKGNVTYIDIYSHVENNPAQSVYNEG